MLDDTDKTEELMQTGVSDMTTTVKWAWGSLVIAVFLGSIGCGGADLPELGTVTGKVTLDGKPLAGVMVQFHPLSEGRPGSGVTDKDGNYVLTYDGGAKGTKVGPNKVEINTIWPDGEPEPGQNEQIPAKYNSATTLQEVIKKGSNAFDFALQSK